MKDTRYLTFALCKGRLAKQTLELLEELGITCEEMKDKNSRKLIFVNEELKLKFFLIERTGCTDLCRIWCGGHRRGRKRHDSGRGTEGT